MTTMEVHRVAVVFAATSIFSDVSMRLEAGWHGLVGANGAGKTTLLRVLAGELTPSVGQVHVRPRDAVVALCAQAAPLEPTDDVLFFAEASGEDAELRSRLSLRAHELERWATLSPGERKRWQIGAALARAPDVLLLDEPTNHLDGAGRALLVSALRRFRGVGVVVSHDRALLEEMCPTTIWLHDATISTFAASISEAVQAFTRARRVAEDEHAALRGRAASAARRLDEARRCQAAADRGCSAGARMRNAHDSDARGGLAQTRASAAEARAGRTVGVLRRQLARAEEAAAAHGLTRDATRGGRVAVTFERAATPILFHLEADELRAGERVVLRDVRITIRREDRVHVHGANGAGKTTLLDALAAASPRDDVLHLPQELAPEQLEALGRELCGLDREARGRVLAIVDALGSDVARIAGRRDGASLSPGEARKLALALGLARKVRALVLDEPTNHMDLPSLERLEDALGDYPGCIVLVTHDDAFAAALTTRTLHVANGSVM